MTRVGILSVAHMHARGYARALKSIEGVEISGVYDHDIERAKVFAELNGIDLSRDLNDLLERSDAVIICAENANHWSYVEPAARLGTSMLCEKPLSNNVESGMKILQTIRATGAPFFMALPIRFVASVQEARTAVRCGAIGRVVSMTGTNHGSVPGGWFTDRALSGGGAVADHVPHVADIMRWVLGENVTEVYAEIGVGNFASTNEATGNTPIDDSAIVTMTWADGTFSTLDPSWSRIQGVYPEWGDVVLEVVGTQGVVSVNASGNKIDSFTKNVPNHRYLSFGDNADLNLVSEFVTCVREERKSDTLADVEDGMHALRVASAAYESARTGTAIRIMHE